MTFWHIFVVCYIQYVWWFYVTTFKQNVMKRLVSLLVMAVLLGMGSTAVAQTTLKNYMCKKCATVVNSGSTPSSYGCPAGNSHSWNNLGQVGTRNYLCKKCGTHVESRSTPSSYGCPAGNSHSWNNLGEMGDIAYMCKKCGLAIYSQRTPSSYGCPAGNSHSWSRLSR